MTTLWLALLLSAAPNKATTPGRAAFEKASRLFKGGEYQKALPYFEMAYRLSAQRPSTIYGLAQCERALGRLEDAVAHLEEFILVAPQDQANRAKTALAELRKDAPPRSAEKEPPPPETPPIARALRPPPAPSPPPPRPVVAPAADRDLTSPPVTARSRPDDDTGSFWSHPAPWIVVGALAVATGVTAGLLLSRDAEVHGGTSRVVLNP